jgi:hypothetical protein
MSAIHHKMHLKLSHISKRTIVRLFSSHPLPDTSESIRNNSTMLAWQIYSYGDLKEVQQSSSTRIPMISKPKEVLVKVSATSVNPIDVAMLGKKH